MSRSLAWAAMVAAVGCGAPVDRKLPGASLTSSGSGSGRAAPNLFRERSEVACGDDVALNGDAKPDLLYRYAYDQLGRLTHATGTYAAGGADDEVDYTYDHLDHMTHMLETRSWGDLRVEVTANYDTLGDMLDYTTDQKSLTYHDTLRYTFLGFNDAGQPTSEIVSDSGQPDTHYALAYDDLGRVAFVVQDGGYTTTYTYDDTDTRTTTIDTDNGAYHGVIEFDDQNRELSETWGGTDPAAIATSQTYQYDGDRLLGATYASGTTAAPQDAEVVEIDTLRYDGCDAAERRGPRSVIARH